jgi:hypothetical protein
MILGIQVIPIDSGDFNTIVLYSITMCELMPCAFRQII